MECTEYFRHTRNRADRLRIKDEWIRLAAEQPLNKLLKKAFTAPVLPATGRSNPY
jgi:hypothetical protein